MNRKRLVILGATGSIGRSVADVVGAHRDAFEVLAIVGGSDANALASMARELGASFAAIADEGGRLKRCTGRNIDQERRG